nr:unnamed protein product [Spirometra erinaceieuropaei]
MSIRKDNSQFSDSDEDNWSDEDTDDYLDAKRPNFPDFEKLVNQGIESLDGYVFAKLNWSAPKDATWVSFGNSLKCHSAADILLLLKASDFVSYDILAPFSLCSDASAPDQAHTDLKLILRRWHDFRPEGEFRCFVKSRSIIAISQRNWDAYFTFVDTEQANIVQAIVKFFQEKVRDRFPLQDYVLDVYTSRNFRSSKCVKIIDFNVFGPPTDALLFQWPELEAANPDQEIWFRKQEDKSLRSGNLNKYKIPIDLADIASGADPAKLIDLVQAQVEEQNEAAAKERSSQS